MAEASKNDKKVFDVARPGKTPPSETARPVIMGHKMMTHDPMMSMGGKTQDTAIADPLKQPVAAKPKTIQPIRISETPADEPPKNTPKAEKPAPTPKPIAPSEKPAPEPAATATPEPSTEDTDTPEDTDPAAKEIAKQREQQEKELARQAAIDQLITEKKYHLRINEKGSTSGASKIITWVVLVLILLIGVYLAADAGMISLPISLPVDIIKN